MAVGSGQVVVGASTPVLLAGSTRRGVGEQTGWAYISVPSGGGNVFLGGSHVSSANGVAVAAGGTLPVLLFSGDQLFGLASTGSVTVSVLQTGA